MIPNTITLSRILALPFALYFWEVHFYVEAIATTFWILISDFFDGWLARKLNQITSIGQILDPIADKIVAMTFFGYFFWKGYAPFWYVSLIYTRDIAQIMSVPILIWYKKIIFKVKPKSIPKWGTSLNFVLLGIFSLNLIPDALSIIEWIQPYTWSILIISSIIELYILFTYLPRFFQIYRGHHDTFE